MLDVCEGKATGCGRLLILPGRGTRRLTKRELTRTELERVEGCRYDVSSSATRFLPSRVDRSTTSEFPMARPLFRSGSTKLLLNRRASRVDRSTTSQHNDGHQRRRIRFPRSEWMQPCVPSTATYPSSIVLLRFILLPPPSQPTGTQALGNKQDRLHRCPAVDHPRRGEQE